MPKLGIRCATGLLLGVVALAATTWSAVLADAQEKAAATRAFEVATIKRSPPLNGGAIFIRGGGLRGSQWTATGVTLLMLLRNAYGQRFPMEAQYIGAPSWAETDRFDVVAKAESAPAADQVGPMLQTLLADSIQAPGPHRDPRAAGLRTGTRARKSQARAEDASRRRRLPGDHGRPETG